ncbi:hypothetical protein D3C75_1297960 [compost metagenome]
MLSQLNSIGVFDNEAGRDYLQEQFTRALFDTTNATTQANGRVMKEFLLMGPNGSVKVQSVWDGNKLITAELYGGKAID